MDRKMTTILAVKPTAKPFQDWWGYQSISLKTTAGQKVDNADGEGVVIYVLENEFLLKQQSDCQPGFDGIELLHGPESRLDRPSSDFHGNIVLSIIKNTAPKAKIYVLRRGTTAEELDWTLQVIMKHRQRHHQGQPALINCSFGVGVRAVASSQVNALFSCYKTIDKVLEAGILIVAAAGNEKGIEITPEMRSRYLGHVESLSLQVAQMKEANEESKWNENIKKATNNKAGDALNESLRKIDGLGLPAMHPGGLMVGGYDKGFNCRHFYYGAGIDVYAPGCDVPVPRLKDVQGGGKEFDQGTSFAAPLVTGSIASFLMTRSNEGGRKLPIPFNSAALKQKVLDMAVPIVEPTVNKEGLYPSTGYRAFRIQLHKIDYEKGTQHVPERTEEQKETEELERREQVRNARRAKGDTGPRSNSLGGNSRLSKPNLARL